MRYGQTGRAAVVLVVLAQILMTRSGVAITHAQEGREAMLARAAEAELDTEYAPPPGDPLWHHTAGFAKTPLVSPARTVRQVRGSRIRAGNRSLRQLPAAGL